MKKLKTTLLLLLMTSLIIFAMDISFKSKRTYTTKTHINKFLQGKASWYGDYFQGRKTANGEIFDMNKISVAHKTLPFGTKLVVTNKDNNKSILVTVNDRGPYVKGRIIDLSKFAFSQIASTDTGVLNVSIEILN